MSIALSQSRLVTRHVREGSHPRVAGRALALAAALAFSAIAPPASAQSGKGFLFKRPTGSFSLRAGYALANAGSDVFSEATRQLTLDKNDFSAITWGGDISYSATPRTDLVFDGGYSSSSVPSEFREFTDNNDLPIQQSTKYRRVPLTVGLKYYLADRGRSVGEFAYIPSKIAPYVGVGAGAMWYKFEQNGDFVDFNTPDLEIFSATLESKGWTPMGQGTAGVDYTIGPWLALTGEGRYQWARARLDPDVFSGFQKIDLSGFTGTVGFKVRF
jgi:outer membrane protein W